VEIIPLTFGKINGGSGGFNRWTINGESFVATGGTPICG